MPRGWLVVRVVAGGLRVEYIRWLGVHAPLHQVLPGIAAPVLLAKMMSTECLDVSCQSIMCGSVDVVAYLASPSLHSPLTTSVRSSCDPRPKKAASLPHKLSMTRSFAVLTDTLDLRLLSSPSRPRMKSRCESPVEEQQQQHQRPS